jgi:hypothetical protein
MPRRREDDDERNLGAAALGTALGGPVLGGVLGVGGLTGEGRPRPHDPAPIGSDPWLERELRAALKKAGLEATLEVKDAIVTVHAPQSASLERALASVQGTKAIRWA